MHIVELNGVEMSCNTCGRDATNKEWIDCPAMPYFGITEPWGFWYCLCRWCKGWETRKCNKNNKLKIKYDEKLQTGGIMASLGADDELGGRIYGL